MTDISIFNIKNKYRKKYKKKGFNAKVFKGDKENFTPESVNEDLEKYSLSEDKDAQIISDIIIKKTGQDVIVLDATTSIGGNTLNFIKNFKKVVGCEINNMRYNKLIENIKHNFVITEEEVDENKLKLKINYNNESKYVTLFNNSFVNIMKKCRHDVNVVFFDPPWGGRKYKYHKNLILGLSGLPMEIICENIFKNFVKINLIVLKLPFNYFIKSFDILKKHNIIIHKQKIRNYIVIILQKE